MKYYLAIDIGASSGRHMVGHMENGELICEEVFRFPNGVKEENGHLVWDIDALFFNVKEGIKKKEFTHGSTTGIVNAVSGEFDQSILSKLRLPQRLFPLLSQPGTVVGELLPEIAAEVGGSCKVVFCATHDTASAVEGIPMEENAPYISSGTWSLLGVKTPKPLTDERSEAANYSNEGGVGDYRYQKNIMGLWLANSLRKELCPDTPFPEITAQAKKSDYDEIVDANAQIFFSPDSMKAAFDSVLEKRPKKPADYFRCAYRSLAMS